MECRDSRRFEGRLLPSLLAFLWMAMIVRPECVAALEPETLSFNIHVRPILSDKCFACHGFDSKKRQAELRLDTSQGSRENHNGRAAIVGKDLAASEMWRRITTTDETELMPPAESHKTLSAKEKEIIRLWIEQGANYQKHWAFEDLAKSELPLNETAAHPIDAFIASRLAEHSLKLAPEAKRRPHPRFCNCWKATQSRFSNCLRCCH